ALVERLHHPVDGIEPAPAIREGADPRQHDALSAPHQIGIARHCDLHRGARFAPGTLECLGGRMQVTRAIVHDGDGHLDPPGCGNSPTISDAPADAADTLALENGAPAAADADACGSPCSQASKNLRSADSTSSPTTMPAFCQRRRV